MNTNNYYCNNETYSIYLDNQKADTFLKYVDYIIKYTKARSTILDVGCGTGVALSMLNKKNRRYTQGIDVSITSIKRCKAKKNNCRTYDGNKIPFNNKSFDLVGSFNVLEHISDAVLSLEEMLRVTKPGGNIIIICPNFLSITNNFHPHTQGILQKLKNLINMVGLLLSKETIFSHMSLLVRVEFQPDDDAVTVTNPISIIRWARSSNLGIEYWSSQEKYKEGIVHLLDISLLKYFFGSCFFVFRKK